MEFPSGGKCTDPTISSDVIADCTESSDVLDSESESVSLVLSLTDSSFRTPWLVRLNLSLGSFDVLILDVLVQ